MEEKAQEYYTLITGASEGIGKAMAYECGKRGMNLVLTSLPGPGLKNVADIIIKQFGVKVITLEKDLTAPEAPKEIYTWVKNQNLKVNMLINNAGKGCLGPFDHFSYEFYYKMMQLNMVSLVLLSRLFIPEMKSYPQSYILNLGSVASFYPIPYKVIYAASKGFVYSFSRALREELKHTSVHVSVLCAGSVITSPEVLKRIRKSGFFGKASSIRPAKLAQYTITKLLAKKPVIIPGRFNMLFIFLNKLLPSSYKQSFLARKFNNGTVGGDIKTKE
ncbi:MAG: SDR family NAD(P)-dependent oxidoreductase [Bacteroidales bacterium]|nr:SDR family NAD(P)-dependent oxidoreductase [Bacteroidales bacterium]